MILKQDLNGEQLAKLLAYVHGEHNLILEAELFDRQRSHEKTSVSKIKSINVCESRTDGLIYSVTVETKDTYKNPDNPATAVPVPIRYHQEVLKILHA